MFRAQPCVLAAGGVGGSRAAEFAPKQMSSLSPRAAFRILKPGGRLIVLDLLLHTFEEARELYADRWLGFSECELATMLERAGFTHIETVVADRETSAPGFQTLLGIDVRPVEAAGNGTCQVACEESARTISPRTISLSPCTRLI